MSIKTLRLAALADTALAGTPSASAGTARDPKDTA